MSIRSAATGGAIALALAAPGLVGAAQPTPAPTGAVRVAVETPFGTIEIALDATRAPATTANFLRYVDSGFYNGGRFHRALRPGTDLDTAHPVALIQASRAPRTAGFPPIPLEGPAAALPHVDGAVAMADSGSGTATSDFFICIGDERAIDEGGARTRRGERFPVFGRVIAGMEVVRRIQSAPVFPGSDVLEPPIPISKASRLREEVRR